MRNRFGFAYNNLGICPLFIWRTMASLTLTELLRFLICSLTNLISFKKTVVIQACTKTRNSDTKRPKRNKRNYRNERSEKKQPKRPNETIETIETKRSKRNDRNETTVIVSFRSLRWFLFYRFVLVVSVVLLVSFVSFRSFRFTVSGFLACRFFIVVKYNIR